MTGRREGGREGLGLTQILSFPLSLDDGLIDLARGQVAVVRQANVQEALVVAQILGDGQEEGGREGGREGGIS